MLAQKTTLHDISNEKSLRFDVDYIKYQQAHADGFYAFNELFSIVSEGGYDDSVLTGEFKYCEIGDSDKNGDIVPVSLNFDLRNLEDESYYTKIEKGDITAVDLDDILIAKVRPNLKKYIRITSDKQDVYYTTAFIRLKAKEMPELLYYCLRSIFYEDLMAITRQGKGYPTINEKDLVSLKLNSSVIDKLRSNYPAITVLIKDVEEKILNMRSKTKSSQEIIDSVFQREFGFDYDKFEELKTHRYYTTEKVFFSNNPDLRFSAKFHRPAGDFVMEELIRISDKKIKHFISEPIVLGASISPSDFDESGEAYYVSMATIKTLEVVLDETQLVSSSYFEAKKAKSLQRNDIVVARSGVAIGKTAIVRDDFDGIFADFTMRIRFDEAKYNPLFAYYYLRSKYFQYLIEVYKKGLQNQNIFPIVMQEFPIPDISLPEQQRIVDEIQAEIENQEQIKAEIASLRNQIDEVIIQSISA